MTSGSCWWVATATTNPTGLARVYDALGRQPEARRARDAGVRLVQTIASDVPNELPDRYLQVAERAVGLRARRTPRDRAGLTAREREVATLVGTGLTNRAIAERLVLGERTIESHVTAVLTKLQLSNRSQRHWPPGRSCSSNQWPAKRLKTTLNPVGQVWAGASVLSCSPNALAQAGSALGTLATEGELRAVASAAGLSHFRLATATPFNRIFEVRR